VQVGCGLKIRRIRGRWYVYGWHYEGGSRKVETYAGRAGKSRTNERAIRFLLDQDVKARAALDRRIEKCRTVLSRIQKG